MSTTDSSAGSTSAQAAIQAGSWSNGVPTSDVEDLVLDQHRQRRRGEVEQEDEEQRPGHRLARLLHRRRGVVAHQDVRQRGRADHQAEHQRQEVAPRVVEGLAPCRRRSGRRRTAARAAACRPAAWRAPRWPPWPRSRPSCASSAVFGSAARAFSAAWISAAGALAAFRSASFLLRRSPVGGQRGRHVLQLGVEPSAALALKMAMTSISFGSAISCFSRSVTFSSW